MLVRDKESTYSISEILGLLEDISSKRQEHFVVVTLDSNRHVINYRVVFMGTVDATIIHPREIFACALDDSAVSIVVAHNHPSGDPTPSSADKKITKQLIAAGNVLSIPLHDHIVVAHRGYFSFRQHGLIHYRR